MARRNIATEIGEDVFIGSDTMLVAPLTLGDGARTGAGAVVTKNVPEDTLVVGMPARAIRKLERKTKRNRISHLQAQSLPEAISNTVKAD